MVHILGRVPGSTGSDGRPWTVYVVEPHGNAVFADARLPAGFDPAALAADVAADYPSADRQQLLRVRRRRRLRVDRDRLARVRLAAARASSPAP